MGIKARTLMRELSDTITLLDICLSLHGSNTGSSDPLSKDDEEHYLAILQTGLEEWEPGLKWCEQFDDAVKNLVEKTIRETKLRQLELQGYKVNWTNFDTYPNLLSQIDKYAEDKRFDILGDIINHCYTVASKR